MGNGCSRRHGDKTVAGERLPSVRLSSKGDHTSEQWASGRLQSMTFEDNSRPACASTAVVVVVDAMVADCKVQQHAQLQRFDHGTPKLCCSPKDCTPSDDDAAAAPVRLSSTVVTTAKRHRRWHRKLDGASFTSIPLPQQQASSTSLQELASFCPVGLPHVFQLPDALHPTSNGAMGGRGSVSLVSEGVVHAAGGGGNGSASSTGSNTILRWTVLASTSVPPPAPWAKGGGLPPSPRAAHTTHGHGTATVNTSGRGAPQRHGTPPLHPRRPPSSVPAS